MKDTLQLINQMQRDGVIEKYAIGGAVGALYYLEAAATMDVDIFIMLPVMHGSLLSLAPIYEYLKQRGCRTDKEYVLIGKWPVQFLPPSGNLEEEALRDAVEARVDNVQTWVMTAEHLVAIALKTGRTKDISRILQFLEEKAVNLNKLKKVLSRHGLSAKWQAFQRKYLSQ